MSARFEYITTVEALQMLIDNDAKPIKGLYFRDDPNAEWRKDDLCGLIVDGIISQYPFRTAANMFQQCARQIIEASLPQNVIDAIRVLFPWAKFIAQDSDGEVWIYKYKPEVNVLSWVIEYSSRTRYLTDIKPYASDWKQSLIEIKGGEQ